MTVTTPIIPSKSHFVGIPKTLDYEAISVFVATGFFLDQDTYFKEQKVLRPAQHYELDALGRKIISNRSYFKWHYQPQERSFDHVVSEFGDLFESIIAEQVVGKRVVLPLSGGLDSRTQAVALKRLSAEVNSYSYAFQGGHDETWYGNQIANICDFPFQSMQVPKGYLWDVIEPLAVINGCYSEFTHPRQMAFMDCYSKMGDVFSLGHWGDVLYDDMGVPDQLPIDAQVEVVMGKIVKKSGLLLAETLWKVWGLSGDFKTYLKQRLYDLLQAIDIPENANGRIRAFKSLYWAPRWTSVNLSVYEAVKPIALPYYDNRMCEFICSVPERYLAGRQIQIAYIKERMPALAKLTWQAQRPFNLYSYPYNKVPWNLPYRVFNKLQRKLTSKPYVQRNWELQFLGDANDEQLQHWLFNTTSFSSMLPKLVVEEAYQAFKYSDGVHESHALSMLLTLALFSKQQKVSSN